MKRTTNVIALSGTKITKVIASSEKVEIIIEDEVEQYDWRSIKSIEDAYNVLHEVRNIPENATKDEIAYIDLKVVNRAINQRWTPNWEDTDQRKWFPWFKGLSSGFDFSGTVYRYDYTFTYVSSRLCFETEAKAKFAGKTFINLYEDFLF